MAPAEVCASHTAATPVSQFNNDTATEPDREADPND